MDVSKKFSASVKKVHSRNEMLGDTSMEGSPKKPRGKSSFFIKAQTVLSRIYELREFLMENRQAYLNFSRHLPIVPRMTDLERDEIDIGVESIINICMKLVKELKREIAASEVSQQNAEHREIILLLTEEYLKNVCKIYSEQRAMRVKKVIEKQRMLKMRFELLGDWPTPHELPALKTRRRSTGGNTSEHEIVSNTSDRETTNNSSESSPMKVQEINGDMDSTLKYDEELSPEDIQTFQAENEQLYNELTAVTEEVDQIENTVIHIAHLQDIFTKKVMDQDRDVNRLVTAVVGSTENVKQANEQIRHAIQRNAGTRVWILFFLLVMSFSLLFLDWYNP